MTDVLHALAPSFEQIEGLYTLRGRAAVRAWLDANPELLPVLAEARPHIAAIFPNAQPYLEVVTDPEIAYYKELFVFIAVDTDPDDVVPLLDQFNAAWWLKLSAALHKKMDFLLEYR